MRSRILESLVNCVLLSFAVFTATSVVFLSLTWELGSSWGSLSSHATYIGPALLDLTQRDSALWREYWDLLGQHGYQLDFLIHTSIPLIASSAISMKAFLILTTDVRGVDNVRHISGPRLYEGKNAFRHAMKQFRKELKHDKKHGIRLHPRVPITIKRELGNISVVGKQGAGKSVIIKYLLSLILLRLDKALVFDVKREYIPYLYDQNAALVGHSDSRSKTWHIAMDASTPERALLCSTHLVNLESDDPMWTDGARLILAGSMCALNATHGTNWGWPDLQRALEWEKDELIANIKKYYPRAKRVVVEHCRTTDSFLVTLTSRLGWVATLAEAWPDHNHQPFSIRNWVLDQHAPKIVVVVNDAQHEAISGPMCAAFLSLMTAEVLSQPDSDTRRIWFVLDELASFPKCSALEDWLSKGRSKGARTIAGYQSYSQLDSIYGEYDAQTIVSLFSNVIGLQCGAAGGSAERTARGFGERVVERPVVSVNGNGEISTTFQRSTEPLVRAEDLVHLDQPDANGVEGFLCVGGTNSVYRLKWPYPSLISKANAFEQADLLIKPTSQATHTRRNRRRRA